MNIYDISVKKADGTMESLSKYKGTAMLIVNTASLCGYTKQLPDLEQMYQDNKDKGFVVLAFPCNQFLEQEPASIEEIQKHYADKYGVTFPIYAKLDVRGENQDPLYKYLTETIGFDPATNTPEVMFPHYANINPDWENSSDIKWNFTKFLVDKSGNIVSRIEPQVKPHRFADQVSNVLK